MSIVPNRRVARSTGLVTITLLHVAAVFLWHRPTPRLPDSDVAEERIVMLLTSPHISRKPTKLDQTPAPVRTRPERLLRPRPAPVQHKPTASVEAAAPSEPVVAPASVPEDPFDADTGRVADGAAAQSLKERSLSLAKAVDQQLRKESRWEKDRVIAQESELARSIAAAYRERSYSLVENRLINGDTLAKVRTPFGTYCMRVNGNRFVGARDPFKDTGKVTLLRCPKD